MPLLLVLKVQVLGIGVSRLGPTATALLVLPGYYPTTTTSITISSCCDDSLSARRTLGPCRIAGSGLRDPIHVLKRSRDSRNLDYAKAPNLKPYTAYTESRTLPNQTESKQRSHPTLPPAIFQSVIPNPPNAATLNPNPN